MTTTDKNLVKNQVKSSIEHRIGAVAAQAYIEIIDALCYACTFKNPRRFADIEMNERTWQDFASSITVGELRSVASSTSKCQSKNRLFYTLGCLARTYARRKSSLSQADYAQRRYTNADFASVITPIDALKNIEW